MDFSARFLRTRVARRVLSLFVVGTLVPVIVMAVISFFAVRSQLEDAVSDRLRRMARNAAQSVAQQLFVAQNGIRQVGRMLAADAGGVGAGLVAAPPSTEALAIVENGAAPRPLVGSVGAIPALDDAQTAHLARGGMVVSVSEEPLQLLAAVAMDTADVAAGVLWARLAPDSIWGAAEQFTDLSTRADFCVLGGDDRALFCLSGRPGLPAAFASAQLQDDHAGVFEATVDGQHLFTGYNRLLLAAAFAAPTWTILVSETAASVQAPLSTFSYSFPLALLMGILAVLLLTNTQVRRTMEPLGALEAGTRSIAAGDLDTRIHVNSPDEFGALAGSFNRMAEHLGLMFQQVEAGRAIDQAVLRRRSADEAVTVVLERFSTLVPCRSVSVLLTLDQRRGLGRLRSRVCDGDEHNDVVSVADEAWTWLRDLGDHQVVPESSPLPGAPGHPSASDGTRVVFPFVARDHVLGALWYVPARDSAAQDGDALLRARQVADQATVALDELRLLQELEELNWGALHALARAIDAKSRWTAGHSERVTELSIDIARELDIADDTLEVLRRGGLLHDVGKIGVPAHILDMPGELSPEDRKLMEQHPTIGVQILEPIAAFRESLPIVGQHHEHWDGNGYPEGLAGEEIDPLARVLAVADVYDAMVSARPYRTGLNPEDVVAHISGRRGTHFEPRAVDAFLRVIADRGVPVSAHG